MTRAKLSRDIITQKQRSSLKAGKVYVPDMEMRKSLSQAEKGLMGNRICEDVEVYMNDACGLAKCVSGITGKSSNSRSPSDTWFLRFHKGTSYGGKPLTKAFMKWWINPSSLRKSDASYNATPMMALDYEVPVYRDIIRPMIDLKVCPHFVRFLATGNQCLFPDLRRMMCPKGVTTENLKKIESNMARNLAYMKHQRPGRPAVDEEDAKIAAVYNDIQALKKHFYFPWTYNILITECAAPNTLNFKEFWYKHHADKTVVWPVILQVLIGCYAMSLSKMTHNDIHFLNVMVEPLPRLTKFVYQIEGQIWVVWSRWLAKIFDFDHATATRFGENRLLSKSQTLFDVNHTNEVVPNKDMVKFLVSCFHFQDKCPATWMQLKTIIKPGMEDELQNLSFHLVNRITKKRFEPKDFAKLNSPASILWAAFHHGTIKAKTAVFAGDSRDLVGDTVYRIATDMFTANGTLKQTIRASPDALQTAKLAYDDARDIMDLARQHIRCIPAIDTQQSLAAKQRFQIAMDWLAALRRVIDRRDGSDILTSRAESALRAAKNAYSQITDI